ncbi:hypothetical protein TR13x_09185 [Caloranaerobacter sp. TR13]|uniref:hypothetical protein n=1 Tax=Caloranaerobacter sp. TR13 TaxID=1302151 RepID=UPI0006D431EA|nr:hypothetical protein [Caloranaerobacter sp. TR13]KPU26655.1 hypothetical protein TR13x_09185 [Caloranaerobacter sp. TR13]
MIIYILGIIFFALATMFVYSWGYVKEQRIDTELKIKLTKKAQRKVINALRRNGAMTKKELGNILSNLKVSNFGSKRKLIIKNTEVFTKSLLQEMVRKGMLEIDYKSKPKKYYLKEKNATN